MTWEFNEGTCATCGAYGSWLGLDNLARRFPNGWFHVTTTRAPVMLCSVKCVEAWDRRALGPGPSNTSPLQPPECKKPSST